MLEKPERPIASDCCGSGCSICVYDIYADRLKAYQEQLKKQKKAPKKGLDSTSDSTDSSSSTEG